MKDAVQFSDEDKWQAVVNGDQDCDGMFFYGVKTTGVFCRPSCKAKIPLRDNVVFFNGPEEAMAACFRPCKRCRPDLAVFEPDRELVRLTATMFKQNYTHPIDIKAVAKQLGSSIHHWGRLFKKHMGMTPAQYLTKLRVDKAAELLANTNIPVLEIAYATGFGSLSNFYRSFKTQLGHTPNEHRKGRGGL